MSGTRRAPISEEIPEEERPLAKDEGVVRMVLVFVYGPMKQFALANVVSSLSFMFPGIITHQKT
jgi:hypothetical protein